MTYAHPRSEFRMVGGGWIGAVGGTGVLVGILYFKFARMKKGAVVRFFDWGVELSDAMGLLGGGQQPALPRQGHPQQLSYPPQRPGYPQRQFGYPPQPPGYPRPGRPYR